jgi:transcriptional regulator with XRE-family HTH domain
MPITQEWIGQDFRRRRLALGLTQQQVADLASIHMQTVWSAENAGNITIGSIEAIDAALAAAEQAASAPAQEAPADD